MKMTHTGKATCSNVHSIPEPVSSTTPSATNPRLASLRPRNPKGKVPSQVPKEPTRTPKVKTTKKVPKSIKGNGGSSKGKGKGKEGVPTSSGKSGKKPKAKGSSKKTPELTERQYELLSESYDLWNRSPLTYPDRFQDYDIPYRAAPSAAEGISRPVSPTPSAHAEPPRLKAKRKRGEYEQEDYNPFASSLSPEPLHLPAEPSWRLRKRAKKAVEDQEAKEVEELLFLK